MSKVDSPSVVCAFCSQPAACAVYVEPGYAVPFCRADSYRPQAQVIGFVRRYRRMPRDIRLARRALAKGWLAHPDVRETLFPVGVPTTTSAGVTDAQGRVHFGPPDVGD